MAMELPSLWTCLVLAGSLCLAAGEISDATSSSDTPPQEAVLLQELSGLGLTPDDLKPLFLTPMIKECQYDLAKNKSKLDIFNMTANVSAYSGYITVHNNTNNLFFVFVKAQENPSTAPLLLWTPGGPGLSSVFSLLLQNGPVMFDATGNLTKRKLTIQTSMNVIYLDAPVGAGFSFTKNHTTYSKSLEDVAKDIKEFLNQFLLLFSEYKKRDFYAAGDSYGARFSVALAHDMIKNSSEVDLNLQGVIGGVGFFAPVYYSADSCDFLLQASMVRGNECEAFRSQLQFTKHLAEKGNITDALFLLFATIFTSSDPTRKTLFQNLTLYNSHASALYTERPSPMITSFFIANQTQFKILIHAGQNASLEYANKHLLLNLAADWFVDITNRTEYVLNNTKVLFYAGQVDTLFPSAKMQVYFDSLNWTHASDYRNATRRLWQPYQGYGGGAAYTKSAGNFTSAVVLGMGHYAGFDKPLETHYLITQFVNGSILFPPPEMLIN